LEHFIKIAEMKVIQEPGILKTVVGSCIALCIWDRVRKMGGMVHIMMPKSKNNSPLSAGKYANTAVSALYNEMISRNCQKRHLVASMAGGASVFGNRLGNNGRKPIGVENYEIVKEQLQQHRIPIEKEDVGGTSGRRVVFNITDGDIFVSMLNNKSYVTVKKTIREQ